jgi:hypothetical protein
LQELEQACRAGLERTDVLNCQPSQELMKLLAR